MTCRTVRRQAEGVDFRGPACKERGMSTDRRQAEGRAVRETVLVVRNEDRAALVVRGGERSTWLNGLVTCDLTKLAPADGAYGLLVEKKGKIQTDLVIVPGPDALVLSVPQALREATFATLDHYLVMEDAELEQVDMAFWWLHGPKATALAATLALPHTGNVDVLGSGGAVVAVPLAEADEVATRLAREAAAIGGVVTDDDGWNAVRIEAGLPRFGVEFDATLYPQEASLEKLAVSFSKGCYLGQEVVYMLENRGHAKKKLVPLDIDVDGDLLPAVGSPVTTPAGDAIGEVKSAVVGPVSGKPVAIAMVKWAQTKAGTELRADGKLARVR